MQERPTWQNWSGGIIATPRAVAAPTSEAALIDAVVAANRARTELRVAGTGHSFVPLCATTGMLVTLDSLQGVVAADTAGERATVWAGSKIHQLGEPLLATGLAMANMGDIDRQAIAGAVSTGTHGTGRTLGNISTQVVGLRLVLASGESVDSSPEVEPEIFNAARVSLGLVGVLSRITLRLLPAYRLHERTWLATFDDCMAQLDDLIAANRHFEYFWVPGEDTCAMKALNPTDLPIGTALAPAPPATGRLTRYVQPERVDWSYRIFPSERNNRFNEMEFAVPAASGPDCVREIRELMRRRHPDVAWPIEYRTLRADDIPLSPAQGRDTVTISIHQGAELPYRDFFADAEAIFRNHRGRPHWGKIHWHAARELRDLYPQWGHFLTIRERLDPERRFVNAYLREMLFSADD